MSVARSLGDRTMPHRLIAGWLGAEAAAGLFSYAVSQETNFKPTKVRREGEKGRIDPSIRRSHILRDLGPFDALLRDRAEALRPALEAAFGISPAPPGETEIEMVAHGDGHFYRAHIDTFTGDDATEGANRRLSLVYYLHRQPRAFSGGHLRLNGLGSGQSVSFAPVCDTLIAFPSFLPHEVEPVSCPGGSFADSRFSVNIWICGPPVKRAP